MNNKSKKTDLDRKFKLVKDSGDVRKYEKSFACGSSQTTQMNKNCDRGDPIARVGVEKVRLTEKRLNDVLPRNIERSPSTLKEDGRMKYIKEMKKIKENYTIRHKYSNAKRDNECVEKIIATKVESEIRNDRAKLNEESKCPVSPSTVKSPASSEGTDLRRKMPSKTTLSQQFIRRPIIKTITSKNDKGKVFKAVNFVERKLQPTQLQINIPTDLKSKENTKSVTSKASVKVRRKKESHKKNFKTAFSPDVTVKIKSPPTEVAKWANVDHTKVYYEAWVDTTLAAISKKVKQKNFDKQKLIHTFEKALADRPVSPDFNYNMLLDERYTGKIRVNKR